MMDRRILGTLLGTAAVAAVFFAAWAPGRGGRAGAAEPRDPAATTEREVSRTPGPPARTAVSVETAAVEAEPPAGAGLERSRGFVRNARGSPVSDVGVGTLADLERGTPAVRSGADGTFEIALRETLPVTLVAVDPAWVTVRSGAAFGEGGPEAVLVVAEAVAVAGRVVDPDGIGLAGADLRVDVPVQDLAGSAELLALTQREEWRATSGEDGRFALQRVPAVDSGRLVASLRGYEPARVALPRASADDLVIELAPLVDSGPGVSGRVVFSDGAAAPGATVTLGSARTRSGADGAFDLRFDSATPADRLVAVLPGLQPAVEPDFGAEVERRGAPIQGVRLVLGPATLTIAGRILDERGEPCPGWRVAVLDGTPIDSLSTAGPRAEDLATERGGPVRTGKDGSFVVGGLAARAYVLRAFRTQPPAQIVSEPIQAGARDVVLRLPPAAEPSPTRGSVRTRDGTPIEGVRVGVGAVSARLPGEPATPGDPVLTDAEGRFELASVPAGWIELVVEGESVLPASVLLAPDAPRDGVSIEVRRRASFRFDASSLEDPPDELRLVGSAGEGVATWSFEGERPRASGRVRLDAGRSGPVTVGEGELVLRVLRRGEELDRVAVTLDPARETEVVWP